MDLDRFVDYFNKEDNFSKTNNIKLIKMDIGYAQAELEVKESGCNFMGSLHGGAMFTLADVVAGSSII
jgi:acyl-CoA thioesterase